MFIFEKNMKIPTKQNIELDKKKSKYVYNLSTTSKNF